MNTVIPLVYLCCVCLFQWDAVAYSFIALLAIFCWGLLTKKRAAPVKEKPPGRQVYISVIVPIHNEGRNILSLLESMGRDHPVELIFIDDASTDNSAEVLREFKEAYRYTYVTVAKQACVADVLNQGLARVSAGSNYIGVINGDCTVALDWQRVIDYLTEYGPAGYNLANRARPNGTLAGYLARVEKGFKNYLFTQGAACLNNGYFVRREFLSAAGWSTITEDLNLSLRLRAAGGDIVQTAEHAVIDQIPDTMRKLCNQKYRWVYGDMASRIGQCPRNLFDFVVNLYYFFPGYTLLAFLVYPVYRVYPVQMAIIVMDAVLCYAAVHSVRDALCYAVFQFLFQLYFYLRVAYSYLFIRNYRITW